MKPKLLVIVGPTASGKSSLALEVAREVVGEVICADSRTVYRGMSIGTAKPEGEKGSKVAEGSKVSIHDLFSEKSLLVEGVPHWGIDLVDPDDEFTVADFKVYAEKKIAEITRRGHMPMLVGGTGLYVNAVVDNLSMTSTPPDPVLRQKLEAMTNEELLEAISAVDVETADTIDANNRRRLVRALEIIEKTGKPLSATQTKGESKYDLLMIGLDVDRDELGDRIDMRVNEMVAAGLVDEVRKLKDQYGCEANAMTGIGYRQICAFFLGQIKLREAIDLIKHDTKAYAKRQLTWFRRDERIHWVTSSTATMELVKGFVRS